MLSDGHDASNGQNGHTHPNGDDTMDSKAKRLHFSTRLIHDGSHASEETGAVIPAISLSTTFKQTAVGKHKGYEYTRSLNPNRLAFETLIASLELPDHAAAVKKQTFSSEERTQAENLPSALAFASGSACTQAIVSALVPAGGHIISVSDVYGGTYRYFTKVASTSDIRTTFLDMGATEDLNPREYVQVLEDRLEAAFERGTALVWIETPTNPTLRLVDIQVVAETAHKHEAILVVDNTFLSPYYQRPLELGADIVTHSVTKYLNGHSDVIMGVLASHHEDLLSELRFYQNAGGAVPSSFDCWLAQRGCKTLALRMLQHGITGLTLARWLQKQSWVKEVIYPGLEGDKRRMTRKLAWRQLSATAKEKLQELGYTEASGFPYGGMVSFRLDTSALGSGRSAAEVSSDFLSSLKLFTLAESLGGVESLAELPSLMTHASVSDEDRAKLGIDDELIRLSCGIEDVRDLEADLRAGIASL